MNWCDERLGIVQAADGSIQQPDADAIDAPLASLPVDDLVKGWRVQATTGLKDETPGTHAFSMYFDRLAHHDPARAIGFIEAMFVHEPDDALVALIAEAKLLGQLLHFHGPRVARPLQELALRCPRLRWLLGGQGWSIAGGMIEDEDAKRRLLSICDTQAYDDWKKRYREGGETKNFAALSPAELSPLWVEIMGRSELDKEKDDDWSVLFDFQCELAANEPLRALDLVTAILAIEDNPHVGGLLAAACWRICCRKRMVRSSTRWWPRRHAIRAFARFSAECGSRSSAQQWSNVWKRRGAGSAGSLKRPRHLLVRHCIMVDLQGSLALARARRGWT